MTVGRPDGAPRLWKGRPPRQPAIPRAAKKDALETGLGIESTDATAAAWAPLANRGMVRGGRAGLISLLARAWE